MKKEQPKIHAGFVELAVVELLNFRVYTIVPNVASGLFGSMETDLLCYKDGKFTEVEIKVSAADLKADFNKKHGHRHKFISRLIYAMPEELVLKHGGLIPKECGIISIYWNNHLSKYKAKWYRQAKSRSKEVVPDFFIKDFMRLGCMRIWTLKNKLYNKIY